MFGVMCPHLRATGHEDYQSIRYEHTDIVYYDTMVTFVKYFFSGSHSCTHFIYQQTGVHY